MGKVAKFVGRMTGLIGGFITDGVDGALASLKFSLALMTGNPFIIGATVAADFASTFLTKGPRTPTSAPTVFRQAVSDSYIVYGERRVGGLMVFFHPRKAGGKHYRYFVIAVAGHRCQGVVTWMLNDEAVTVDGSGKVTSGPYANKAWLWFQRGLASETANATFVSECGGKWTSAHKGNDVAAIYAKFEMSDDVVAAGMPNMTAVIEGKDDIYDYRDDTTGYTRNAILCAYDFMNYPREDGGFGAYPDEIPDADYISAQANVCDEDVDGEPRYAIDAVIVTGGTPSATRDAFVANCAGAYTYSCGKHLIRPGYWVPVSATLAERDFNGPLQVSAFLTSDEAVNEVQGSYVDPASGYQSAAFATQTTDPAPDDIRQANLDLAFTTSKNQAERIAAIAVGRGKYEKTAICPMNIAALGTQALDTVAVDTQRYGLDDYAFQVRGWSLSSDMSILLTLREENELIYGEPTPVTPDVVPSIDVADQILTAAETATLIKTSEIVDADPADGLLTADDTTIIIEGHSRRYSDKLVSVDGDTVAVVAPEGELNHIYYDDLDREGGAVTYQVTDDPSVASNSPDNPGRHYVGSVLTAAPGGTNTSGGQVPPGWDPGTFHNEPPTLIVDGQIE